MMFLSCCSARADDLSGGIGKCASIQNERSRLACYDALATSVTASSDNRLTSLDVGGDRVSRPGGNWLMRTGAGYVILQTVATASVVQSITDVSRQPVLVIRCQGYTPSVYVGFGEKIFTPGAPLITSTLFDGHSDIQTQWVASGSGLAAGIWERNQAIALIETLMRSSSFALRVEVPGLDKMSAVFDTSESAKALAPVKDACWPKG
jgi:hypothetical protein